MYNVLVVDFSAYKESIVKTFTQNGYIVEHCESAYDAMKKLKAVDFDLVISEVELPGDNAFDLYNYISRTYPFIPMIMTTDRDIDTFFEVIFNEGIGNVLCKPFKEEEILNLAEKLITRKHIFGLEHYIDGLTETKKIRINGSRQIKKAISMVIDEILGWGFDLGNETMLNLILNEMVINAVYHSHGLTEQKKQRLPVTLGDGEFVDIFFGRSPDMFGIAIDDYRGKLTKMIILDSINNVIKQNNMLEAGGSSNELLSQISETGRGIDLVRKLAGEYCFVMKKDVRTEILILFDIRYNRDTCNAYSSLKIIEDLS